MSILNIGDTVWLIAVKKVKVDWDGFCEILREGVRPSSRIVPLNCEHPEPLRGLRRQPRAHPPFRSSGIETVFWTLSHSAPRLRFEIDVEMTDAELLAAIAEEVFGWHHTYILRGEVFGALPGGAMTFAPTRVPNVLTDPAAAAQLSTKLAELGTIHSQVGMLAASLGMTGHSAATSRERCESALAAVRVLRAERPHTSIEGS